MNYSGAVQYLESLVNFEKTGDFPRHIFFKLARVKSFLSLIGNPQANLKVLHIAGTKGKGSTCIFLAYILREAGFRVGLYTSPHLSDFRERIRILRPEAKDLRPKTDFEGMISRRELTQYVSRLKPAVERFKKFSRFGELTFFEVYTALAFLYFKENQVDFAVLETGLGGRLDATNTAEALVAGITPISYEHTAILGKTLGKIAGEKAGIIKVPQCPSAPAPQLVVSAEQRAEAKKVIRRRCQEAGAKLFAVGWDIRWKKINGGFKIKGRIDHYPNLRTRLKGGHQCANAALAVGMVEALRMEGFSISNSAIKKGIAKARWPGRFEKIAKHPDIILDGAQNVASCCALKLTLRENYPGKKIILVLGISQDKDLKGICAELSSVAKKIILTRAASPRATPVEILQRFFPGKETYLTRRVKSAVALARRLAEKNDVILVTGSLFVVGEAREIIRESSWYRYRYR
ncbi:MAG: bifunctional folylpolyglutamate synthase/dihydrofolate synthase [Candidatus Omnitrophota bacterium]